MKEKVKLKKYQKFREILLTLLPKNYRMKRFQTKREMKLLKDELV